MSLRAVRTHLTEEPRDLVAAVVGGELHGKGDVHDGGYALARGRAGRRRRHREQGAADAVVAQRQHGRRGGSHGWR
jgi:hypothetical protein